MRTVLIISPHFPPINAPDMQRVRMSLPHFRKSGWEPVVLAVGPRFIEGVEEPLLLDTIPSDITVFRTAAIPARLTKPMSWSSIGLRAFPFLYCSGARVLSQRSIDLIYISTTMFHVMTLGRIWKRQFGVPFVLDMQDPWVSEDWKNPQAPRRGWKARVSGRVDQILEPWTMQQADGLIAVSQDYIASLRSRYARLENLPCRTLAFGGAEADFAVVKRHPKLNRFFTPGDGYLHGVYVGRGGPDMETALAIVFEAFRTGLAREPELFSLVKLHFIGTDYAVDHRRKKTIEPVAQRFDVAAAHVMEDPARIPYFEALQLLLDADFLIVPGSDDPQYTASKIFPYILARKPLLAVFHQRSSVCSILRATGAGSVLPFDTEVPSNYAGELLTLWTRILRSLPFSPPTNWREFEPYSAAEMTKQQCMLFDQVISQTQAQQPSDGPTEEAIVNGVRP